MTGIGEFLRDLQDRKNLSMRDAAKAIGVSYSRYNEILLGRSRNTGKPTRPSATFLGKVSRYYEVPLPVLLEKAGLTEAISGPDEEESELLKIYRGLSPVARSLGLSILRTIETQDRQKSLG